jgi:hypothetical protein
LHHQTRTLQNYDGRILDRHKLELEMGEMISTFDGIRREIAVLNRLFLYEVTAVSHSGGRLPLLMLHYSNSFATKKIRWIRS